MIKQRKYSADELDKLKSEVKQFSEPFIFVLVLSLRQVMANLSEYSYFSRGRNCISNEKLDNKRVQQ